MSLAGCVCMEEELVDCGSGESHQGSTLESQKRGGVCACVLGGREGCLYKF